MTLLVSCSLGEAFVGAPALRPFLRAVDGYGVPVSARPAKRRRRKTADPDSPRRTPMDDSNGSDLPEFDLGDDVQDTNTAPSMKKGAKPSSIMSNDPFASESISVNMMGSASKNTKSVSQLIADRSLERKLEFDAAEADESLPDLVELGKASRSGEDAPVGKKRARKEARIAVAAAAKEEKEENSIFSVLQNLPFITENGKISPLKLLENGTWTGIFLLVAWEIYINTPLFDRAAPMTPVVY